MGTAFLLPPLQAAATYASLTNGGNIINPTILKNSNKRPKKKLSLPKQVQN